MRNGFKINWTHQAQRELEDTYAYLTDEWTQKEIEKLSKEIERTVAHIKDNPWIFQETNQTNIYRAVILKVNSIFYQIDRSSRTVTILSFFNNRRKPRHHRHRQ